MNKCVFLDRDGVVNKRLDNYVKNCNEFEFLPKVFESICLLNNKGYDIFIISNQAGIARGMMTEKDLSNIHNNMITEIEKKGGKINDIYYCPHGWDEGCDCRKPKPGMFFQASREHHLDLTKSIFIGDDERDKIAGDAAGLRTILVKPDNNFNRIYNNLSNEVWKRGEIGH